MYISSYSEIVFVYFLFVLYYLYQCWSRSTQASLTADQKDKCTIVVAAYLQNEIQVIEKSLASFLRVRGVSEIILTWNGPLAAKDASILDRIYSMSNRIRVVHVTDSTSKAENINYVLGDIRDSFVIICDADDILEPHAFETLYAHMQDDKHVVCVQGRFWVKRSGNFLVWCMDIVEQMVFMNLTSILGQTYLFKGHNGLWRKSFLLEQKFDSDVLIEDFHISFQTLKRGKTIRMANITGTCLSAPSIKAYFTQRARWYHGAFQKQNLSLLPGIFYISHAIILYVLFKVWWSGPLFAFLLTNGNLSYTAGSAIGVYAYIWTIPINLFFMIKRIVLNDLRWNVTPRKIKAFINNNKEQMKLVKSPSKYWTRR